MVLTMLGACATEATPEGAPVPSDMSAEGESDQALAELADGFLTYQEYRAAFERFRKCIVESGEALVGVSFDRLSGMVNYSVTTGDDICYNREFAGADMAWQLDPNRPRSKDELQQMSQIEGCIRDLGVEPVEASTQDELFDQLRESGGDPVECIMGALGS